ncbi:MAG: sensor histidine kinase [Eubacterium sp.]
MMPEISLNVLDVAENSIRANASLVKITVDIQQKQDTLTITFEDNGCGMTKDQIDKVEDPFFTTRTTRKVGLGIPFFKMAAENTGGSFSIKSEPGVGTITKAVFGLSHIDRMPLGDITGTIHTLITFNADTDFIYTYIFNKNSFVLDTREFKEVLGGIPLNTPDVSAYIKGFLEENKLEVDGGIIV